MAGLLAVGVVEPSFFFVSFNIILSTLGVVHLLEECFLVNWGPDFVLSPAKVFQTMNGLPFKQIRQMGF